MASSKISELRSILVPANILGSHGMTAAAAFLGHLLALANKPITFSAGRSCGLKRFNAFIASVREGSSRRACIKSSMA